MLNREPGIMFFGQLNEETKMSEAVIDLSKGQRINLAKVAPALKKVRVALSWTVNSRNTGGDFDVDVVAFACKYNDKGEPKLIGNSWFIFYNQLTSPDGCIKHMGDNLVGSEVIDGDCETIVVDLTNISLNVEEISFIVNIHEAQARRQNFGQIRKAAIKLIDDETDSVVAQYILSEDFSTEQSVQFGSLYKNENGWNFMSVGTGYNNGLDKFVLEYGGVM